MTISFSILGTCLCGATSKGTINDPTHLYNNYIIVLSNYIGFSMHYSARVLYYANGWIEHYWTSTLHSPSTLHLSFLPFPLLFLSFPTSSALLLSLLLFPPLPYPNSFPLSFSFTSPLPLPLPPFFSPLFHYDTSQRGLLLSNLHACSFLALMTSPNTWSPTYRISCKNAITIATIRITHPIKSHVDQDNLQTITKG